MTTQAAHALKIVDDLDLIAYALTIAHNTPQQGSAYLGYPLALQALLRLRQYISAPALTAMRSAEEWLRDEETIFDVDDVKKDRIIEGIKRIQHDAQSAAPEGMPEIKMLGEWKKIIGAGDYFIWDKDEANRHPKNKKQYGWQMYSLEENMRRDLDHLPAIPILRPAAIDD